MKRRIITLAIVLAVIVAGWTGAWLYAASLIRDNVAALATADGETTPRLSCDRLDIGGYPFWFDVTCGGLTVTSGDLSATVPELKASLLVYDPWHVNAEATSPLTLADAFTGGKKRLDWQSIEASARLTGWRIARISIVGTGFALNDTVGGDVLMAKASEAEFHLLDMPELYDAAKHRAGLHLYAKADHLNAPGFQIGDAGTTLDASITNLPDDVRTYGDADLPKRWQAAGGQLKIAGFKGDDGARSFDVTGAVGLDAQYRPEGQLTLVSKGLVERYGDLVPAQMRPLVLGAPDKDGNSTQVLNLTNGLIFSGLIPLGTVPPLL